MKLFDFFKTHDNVLCMKNKIVLLGAIAALIATAAAAYYVFHRSEREKIAVPATEGQRTEMAKMFEDRGVNALKLRQLQSQLALYEQMQKAAPESTELQERIAEVRKQIRDLKSLR